MQYCTKNPCNTARKRRKCFLRTSVFKKRKYSYVLKEEALLFDMFIVILDTLQLQHFSPRLQEEITVWYREPVQIVVKMTVGENEPKKL